MGGVHFVLDEQRVRGRTGDAVEVACDHHRDIGAGSNLLETFDQRVHLCAGKALLFPPTISQIG